MRTEDSMRPEAQKGQKSAGTPRGSGKGGNTDGDYLSKKVGSALGNLFPSVSLKTMATKDKGCAMTNVENNRFPLFSEEEIITAAIYKPQNDNEKEGDMEHSDESEGFVEQVNKMFDNKGESSKHKEAQWMATNLSGQEIDMVNQHIFDNAKRQKSTIQISEIKGTHTGTVDTTLGAQNPLNQAAKVVMNPCEMLRKERDERRTSERIQKNMMEAWKKNKSTNKRNNEGTSTNFSNSFSILDDDIIMSKGAQMGVHMDATDFESINMLKDLEIARLSLQEKTRLSTSSELNTEKEVDSHQEIQDSEQILLKWLVEEKSEDDDFTLVTPKRHRKSVRRLTLSGKRYQKKGSKEIPCKLPKKGEAKLGSPILVSPTHPRNKKKNK